MAYKHWTIAELPWDQLQPEAVTPDLLQIIKAASLVEYNAQDYGEYLCRVFHDDADFQAVVDQWVIEEVQHGEALGKWAEAIDPNWSFDVAMKAFREGYTPEHFLNANDNDSVRGSRSGELIARCMVEVGTSSYYTAIGNGASEPVLKIICSKIAGDEFRHYKMFYDALNRYLEKENLGTFKRLKIALSRIAETEDDELSYAYFAANAKADDVYDRVFWNKEYMRRAYSYYQQPQVDRAVAMVFKACGLKPQTLPHKWASSIAWWLLQQNIKKNEKMALSKAA